MSRLSKERNRSICQLSHCLPGTTSMIKSRSAAFYLSYFLSAQMRRSREAHPLRAPKNSCAKFWQVKVPAESGRGRPPRRELYDLWRSTNPELERKTSAEDVDRTRDSLVDPSAGLRQGVSQQMNIEILGILLSTAKPKHAGTRGRRSRSPSEGGRWMTFRPSHWRAEKSGGD
jgi:hypothetical protein